MTILPFGPVLRDLRANLWHLRTYFLILFLVVLLDGLLLWVVEAVIGGARPLNPLFWTGVALDDVVPPRLADQPPHTALGTLLRKINGFVDYVLLGLLFHAIRESFSGHTLRRSRLVFVPTDDEAR